MSKLIERSAPIYGEKCSICEKDAVGYLVKYVEGTPWMTARPVCFDHKGEKPGMVGVLED